MVNIENKVDFTQSVASWFLVNGLFPVDGHLGNEDKASKSDPFLDDSHGCLQIEEVITHLKKEG